MNTLLMPVPENLEPGGEIKSDCWVNRTLIMTSVDGPVLQIICGVSLFCVMKMMMKIRRNEQ